MNNDKQIEQIRGTTIGRKRTISFPRKKITSFSISIKAAKGTPAISEVAAYLIDEKLVEK